MSVPRLNPSLLSDSVKRNLERVLSEKKAVAESPVTQKAGLSDNHKQNKRGSKDGASVARRKTKETLTPENADHLVKSVKIADDGCSFTIVLDVDPNSIPTAQGKGAFVDKAGNVHFFTKPKQRKAEEAFKIALTPYAHLSRSWGEVPVEVDVKLFFAYPSSTPKKLCHKIGPHLCRPDGDNCVKNELDAMTKAGFWKDDSFIDNYHIYKRRTTGPACIVIKITNLQPKFDALFKETEYHDNPDLFHQDSAKNKPSETNPLLDLFPNRNQRCAK